MGGILLASLLTLLALTTTPTPVDHLGRPLFEHDGTPIYYEGPVTAPTENVERPESAPTSGGPYSVEPYQVIASFPSMERGVISADLDQDGFPELIGVVWDAVSQTTGNNIHVWKFGGATNRTPTLVSTTPYPPVLPLPGTHGLAVGQFNGDGLPDLFLGVNGGIYVFINNGALGFLPGVLVAGADAGVLWNLHGDKLVSLPWTNQFTVRGFDGTGMFISSATFNAPFLGFNAIFEVQSAAPPVDSVKDLVITTGQGLSEKVIVRNGLDLAIDQTPPFFVGTSRESPWSGGAGDYNGDNLEDIVVSLADNLPRGRLIICYQDGAGHFDCSGRLDSGVDVPETIKIFRLPSGEMVTVVVHGGWHSLGIYITSSGVTTSETNYRCGIASHYDPVTGAVVADFDHDRCPDIVVSDNQEGKLIFWGVCCNLANIPPAGNSLKGVKATPVDRDAVFLWDSASVPADLLRVSNKRDLGPPMVNPTVVCGTRGPAICDLVNEIQVAPSTSYYQLQETCSPSELQ